MKKSELFFTFILIPVDILMVFLSFVLAYKSRFYLGMVPYAYFEPFAEYFRFMIYTAPLWPIVFALGGLYSTVERRSAWGEFGKIIVNVSAAIALLMVGIFLTRTFFFSRLIIAFIWIIAIVMLTAGRFLIRYIQRYLYRYGVGVHRVIIIGNNGSTKAVISEIKNNRKLGYSLVKLVDREGIAKLSEIIKRNPCDEIIVADSHLDEKTIAKILDFCRLNQLGFKTIPSALAVRSAAMDVRQLAGLPILEFKRTPMDGWGRIIKRIIDIIGSIILIVLLSPILLIVALIIKLSDKGPILFKQERVGLNRNFVLFKFRSMKLEYCTGDEYGGEEAAKLRKELKKKLNEADGPVFKISNDPRITSLGRFIRKTSIDELPQLFNVFKGDMSLVGPRPPLPEEVEDYTEWQKQRLGIKPGITGMWQVSGRSDVSFDEWVKLDVYYIEHWSLWLDFQILLKTVWVVIFGRGAY